MAMLLRVSAWPALRWATGPAVVLGLILNAILGPHGMALSELGQIVADRPAVGLGGLGLWTVAMAPASRAALFAPGLSYLRGLPMPRWLGLGVFAGILVLLHGPVLVLLLAAGQPALAIYLLAAGLGASALLLGWPYGLGSRILASGLALGIGIALQQDVPLVAAALGIVLSGWRIPRAWRDAPARGSVRRGRAVLGGGRLALASAVLLHLWRREISLLLRSALLLVIGAAAVRVLVRANPDVDLTVPVLVAATPFLASIAILIALGIERALATMRWMSVSMSASPRRIELVGLALLILSCVAGVALIVTPAASGPLFAQAAVHALAWASVASVLAHLDPRASRASMYAVLLVVLDVLALALLGSQALLFELAVSLVCVARRGSLRTEEALHA